MKIEQSPIVGGDGAVVPGDDVDWTRLIIRNVIAIGLVLGVWLALSTGYFSNDRTSRGLWNKLESSKSKGTGRVVYEAQFKSEKIGDRSRAVGFWDFYNGATDDTASIKDDALEVRYTSAWIGAFFMHRGFVPSTVYRVKFEANVEGQSGAILMRNRQLDHMREEIPTTNGDFKEFTVYYATPEGSQDQVRLIFMPNERSKVQGRMTIRKFRIEKMDG